MNFTDLIRSSINIVHSSSFDKSNIEFIKASFSPSCNRFVTFENSDKIDIDYSSFDSFVNGIKLRTDLGILVSDALTDPLAAILETSFPEEFREVPQEHGILNFVSQQSQISHKKEFNIRTYSGEFLIQNFALDPRGIAAIPELLNPPYDIIELAAFFVFRPDFIYISSTSPISMKAALFVISEPDLYDITLSENKSTLIRIKHSPKITLANELIPHHGNIQIILMRDLTGNTP